MSFATHHPSAKETRKKTGKCPKGGRKELASSIPSGPPEKKEKKKKEKKKKKRVPVTAAHLLHVSRANSR